jgi:hypothetical protein
MPTPEEEPIDIDVGPDVTKLGFTYLFLRYVLPVLLVLVGLGVLALVLWHYAAAQGYTLVGICVVLILIVIMRT